MIIKPVVKLLIYFAIVLFLCGCALQNKDDVRISENSIKIKSNKTLKIKPTISTFTLIVSDKSNVKLDEKINSILNILTTYRINSDNIVIANDNDNDNDNDDNNKFTKKITIYDVNENITKTIINESVDAGADGFDNLQLMLTDEEIDNIIEITKKNVKTKAEQIARKEGKEIDKIIQLNVNFDLNKTNFTTIPLKGTNLENINHGKINIFMNIDSEFSIKNKNKNKNKNRRKLL